MTELKLVWPVNTTRVANALMSNLAALHRKLFCNSHTGNIGEFSHYREIIGTRFSTIGKGMVKFGLLFPIAGFSLGNNATVILKYQHWKRNGFISQNMGK